MGNCNFSADKDKDSITAISKNNFQFHYAIGRGGFGKVWKVEKKKEKEIYAMKEMSKARVMTKKSVTSVMNELRLLAHVRSPFIVNMHYAFQDRENLYLVLDLLTGGDLRYHIAKYRKFNEEQTKFFVACILQALEVVHACGVIHRDLKPENLVFDNVGYLKLTDFGIARYWTPENASETSGTPGYMAPEVMCRQNHGVAADYFAVGVIVYECMNGRRPYVGKGRREIRDQILSKQVQIKRNEIPEGWSVEAADFINKCLQRKPFNRLGLNGNAEVKSHIWFKDFSWADLLAKKIKAPFIPSLTEDNFDLQHVNKNDWKDADAVKENQLLLRRNSVQSLFKGYFYDKNNANATTIPETKSNTGGSHGLDSTNKDFLDKHDLSGEQQEQQE